MQVKRTEFFVRFLVTTKVTQGAKNFGSFLYSAVNKAGAKIKETVKDNVSFVKEKNNKETARPKDKIHSRKLKTFSLIF